MKTVNIEHCKNSGPKKFRENRFHVDLSINNGKDFGKVLKSIEFFKDVILT